LKPPPRLARAWMVQVVSSPVSTVFTIMVPVG
jgi:hypothetical protein